MAQKIATVSTVFAACDRLEAANGRWNRDDVRNEVGGGGYVVIDPLIKAWRELKPLRETAPTTPAELLHQVATTLESHINGFIGEAESRQLESQQLFDATVLELSQRLEAMKKELEEKEAILGAMTADQANLKEQFEESQQSLSDSQTDNARLVQENDGYRGQIARLESEHKEAIRSLQQDAKEQTKEHTQERKRLGEEHAASLVGQRKELNEAAEQSESRLMMLLDQERQTGKESVADLSSRLAAANETVQAHREQIIEHEAAIRQLRKSNDALIVVVNEKTAENKELSSSLKEQQAQHSLLQREFAAYKDQHRISGDLEALQAAVAGLQEKLEEKKEA